ncbi:hypothetical protein M405DRAFT_792280 [Rhizopogon salebrosus TDB-379]|nr:hypothetical protein M405DRAFT_792280 [Rhizopogon salebrosus TDB-379]
MPVSLPINPFQIDSTPSNAYDVCLVIEGRASEASDTRGHKPSELVCARLLGYMLIHAPVDTGRDYLAKAILSCTDDDDGLKRLGKFYFDHFIRLFKSAKGPTPSPSLHPSRPSFDDDQEALKYGLVEAPKDQSTAKKHALIRDDYRCIVTGNTDFHSEENIPHIAERFLHERVPTVYTQAAHIFPVSTNKRIATDEERHPNTDYAATAWAVADRFGGVKVTEELNGAKIHHLGNVMTMQVDVHMKFDSLTIWFEETVCCGTPNKYNICGRREASLVGLPPTVTFTTTDPRLPLPDPRYLRVHAACARVAHLSGAGECIDRVIRDLQYTDVLATDGSSAEMLDFALMHSLRAQAAF